MCFTHSLCVARHFVTTSSALWSLPKPGGTVICTCSLRICCYVSHCILPGVQTADWPLIMQLFHAAQPLECVGHAAGRAVLWWEHHASVALHVPSASPLPPATRIHCGSALFLDRSGSSGFALPPLLRCCHAHRLHCRPRPARCKCEYRGGYKYELCCGAAWNAAQAVHLRRCFRT